MTAETSVSRAAHDGLHSDAAVHSDLRLLRRLIIGAGVCWAILFVVAGLGYGLQLFGDGSIFSYSVAVEDAWAFHWHNISVRLFTYVFSFVPAETYVALTGHAKGGIVVYGLIAFSTWLGGPKILHFWGQKRGQKPGRRDGNSSKF